MSCEGSEIRLRINQEGGNWMVIRRPGAEPYYRDIADDELPGLLAQYRAIGGDSRKFQAFVTASLQLNGSRETPQALDDSSSNPSHSSIK